MAKPKTADKAHAAAAEPASTPSTKKSKKSSDAAAAAAPAASASKLTKASKSSGTIVAASKPKPAAAAAAAASDAPPLLSIRAQIRISLSPLFMSSPLDGIKDYLNTFVMRYIPELGGVVLSYSDIEPIAPVGHIMDECPFALISVRASFVLFSPSVGSTLYGVVNKVSPDHIGLLVYGVFNASIPSSHIRLDEFAWSTDAHAWQFTSAKDETLQFVASGSVIKFTVASLITANKMLAISGSLTDKPADTGLVDATDLPQPVILEMPSFEDPSADTSAMDVDGAPSATHIAFGDDDDEADEAASNASDDDDDDNDDDDEQDEDEYVASRKKSRSAGKHQAKRPTTPASKPMASKKSAADPTPSKRKRDALEADADLPTKGGSASGSGDAGLVRAAAGEDDDDDAGAGAGATGSAEKKKRRKKRKSKAAGEE
ncbi:hypothetical protein HK105_204229 [Polyrhizophydium stewartii]|uniref:RPA43 OB domain-containing protein n=1 Tax=Polyrhizophydium stewartii TaxID=2732419 RepID=A0ABR4N9D6_9FUNG|nr:hypothetical protein HK105_006671 [Polyrhizophydium stewartii]